MTRLAVGTLVTLVAAAGSGVVAAPAQYARAIPTPARTPTDALPLGDSTALVRQYCVTCHSDRGKAGGLTLASFDAADAVAHADVAEKMIRKLRTGMMPPPGAKRPDASTLARLVTALEQHLDRAAMARPHPGSRPFQRLNRAEYARSVRDLLGIDVDVAAFLPPDTISSGFDNVADVQASSATLMEGYLRAASRISLLAIGDRHASPTEATYRLSRTASQMHHVDGAPMGTRGGLSVVHVFPADGEYSFRIQLQSSSGQLFGSTARDEQLEVSINGARVALLDISPQMSETDPNGMNVHTPRVAVKAGPQRVSAAFIQRFTAPVDDLIAPIEHTMADGQIGLGLGVTTLPHVFDVNINGPFNVTGVSDTVSRRRIFQCRPVTTADETPCARTIVRALAAQAYRGSVSDSVIDRLMGFYAEGRAGADFESGIRMALQAILASPRFLFRFEQAPSALAAGRVYRIGDFGEHVKVMFDLQAAAFAADITRVFTFKLGRDSSARVYPASGVTAGFHPASHHQAREDRIADFAKINKYHVGLMPYFLDKLKNTPDGDGSLLDHSLVVYGSPMGDSNVHNHKRCPLFLVGRAAGKLQGQLHIKTPDGTPMANAMLSMLHLLGVDDLKQFGDSTGTLDLNERPFSSVGAAL